MAQTLTALPSITSPVAKGAGATMVANMTALGNLSRAELLAISAVGSIHSFYPTPNYRVNHAQLIQDALVYWSGVSNLDLNGANLQTLQIMAVMSWDSGYSHDPISIANPLGLSNDVNAILKEARDLSNLPEETLARIVLSAV